MKELLIEAAEVLGWEFYDFAGTILRYKKNGEPHIYCNSDADIAELLQAKIKESLRGTNKYTAELAKLSGEKLDTVGFLTWIIWEATPIQKIEAALQALGGKVE